jgi:4-hydroxybenzoate polyprenyltransferase
VAAQCVDLDLQVHGSFLGLSISIMQTPRLLATLCGMTVNDMADRDKDKPCPKTRPKLRSCRRPR